MRAGGPTLAVSPVPLASPGNPLLYTGLPDQPLYSPEGRNEGTSDWWKTRHASIGWGYPPIRGGVDN